MGNVIEMPLVGILETFDELLEHDRFGAWMENDHLKFFVRSGYHMADRAPRRCIDIANVTVYKPGRGTFTRFLEHVEAKVLERRPDHLIYIENVLRPRFQHFFERRGYQRQHTLTDMDGPPSYWKSVAVNEL